ncbi:lamin-B receptor [Conidiobolus coronatus NRRL 28638]|uniref:Delta(14)-sterol reductase n=1 Tax=Conidiobolus coronatus (strain ATCC 28846 / CBS 209.66 / NRRL 28638) TaxID=796925 RepID=A0A137PGX6_CONC2|nr:lamin-B receptor [Conidiobolus coronatus NRRL 28638]|eukprot:KXN74230.1 lamin-B receptor [Conidiobolus coronatus NRRL 28638]
MTKLKEKQNSANSELNPRTVDLEFFGVIGSTIVSIGTPLFLMIQYVICTDTGCPNNIPNMLRLFSFSHMFSWTAAKIYLGWLAYHLLMWLIVPGEWVKGTKLRNGGYVEYKQNGFKVLLITLTLSVVTFFTVGHTPFLVIYDNFFQLLCTAIVFTTLAALYLHQSSYAPNKLLSLNGNSGHFIYDFWMGRELNPSIGCLDLKEFFELRPGLMGWIMLNLCMLAKQYDQLNGKLTFSMLFVTLSQIYYVIDSLYNQSCVLTTMDIINDGFGYMLMFGDVAWVPFFYTLQARYLTITHVELGWNQIVFVLAMNVIGYIIFRQANGQKDKFRSNPNDPSLAHISYIETDTGRRLMTSGWWGIASHINYFGDWIMSFSQCLACGYTNLIPYFFAVYFFILLVHRDSRDDHNCGLKYGKYWKQYRQLVPYRIIPYVY